MSEVGFAILGATLAGLTQLLAGVTIENFKKKKQAKAEKSNFELVVRLELESTTKKLEKLKTGLNERGFYPFATLNSLQTNLGRLEPQISQIYKTGKDAVTQTEFVTTVTDLTDLERDIRSLENFLLDESTKYNEAERKLKDETQPLPKPTQETTVDVTDNDTLAAAKKDLENVQKLVDQQRSARLVEVVDLKRRCEELIEKFRQPSSS